MKHAGPDALDQLDALVAALRAVPGLQEKSRGAFYRRSRAFLHFHEDPTGLYPDLRDGEEFERLPVTTTAARTRLLRRVTRVCAP